MIKKFLSSIGFGRTPLKVEELENLSEVYCQSCGQDITFKGGDVSDTGRIYCHGFKPDNSRCLDAEFFVQMNQGTFDEEVAIFNYLSLLNEYN